MQRKWQCVNIRRGLFVFGSKGGLEGTSTRGHYWKDNVMAPGKRYLGFNRFVSNATTGATSGQTTQGPEPLGLRFKGTWNFCGT